MGDRMTFGVTDRGGDVLYLYSHWGGADWDLQLANAIKQLGNRTQDVSYGNRIIMSQLVGESWNGTSHYGFSINKVMECDYKFVPIVDIQNENVSIYYWDWDAEQLGDKLVSMSLSDFVDTMSDETERKIMNKIINERIMFNESKVS